MSTHNIHFYAEIRKNFPELSPNTSSARPGFHGVLTHFSLEPPKGLLANSADPDKTLQNAGSDWGLHCLH